MSQGRSLIYPVLHNWGQAENIRDGKGKKVMLSVTKNFCAGLDLSSMCILVTDAPQGVWGYMRHQQKSMV